MKKYFYILAYILTFTSCSNGQKNANNQNFKNDETAFIRSLDLFVQAQHGVYAVVANGQESIKNFKYKDRKDSIPKFFERYKKETIEANERYKDVIKESEKISEKYLNFISHEFKTVYHNQFVGAIRLSYETGLLVINNNYSDDDMKKIAEANIKIDKMLASFWQFFSSIQNDIHKDHPAIEKAVIRIMKDN